MKIISVIENGKVIKKILKHLDLWDVRSRPPPKLKEIFWESDVKNHEAVSQIPQTEDYLYCDPDYPIEDYDS